MRLQECRVEEMAEGVGFEPTNRLPGYTLSKRAPSATRPPLQRSEAAPRRRNIKTGEGIAIAPATRLGAGRPSVGVLLSRWRYRDGNPAPRLGHCALAVAGGRPECLPLKQPKEEAKATGAKHQQPNDQVHHDATGLRGEILYGVGKSLADGPENQQPSGAIGRLVDISTPTRS